jgi:hypothetical protein
MIHASIYLPQVHGQGGVRSAHFLQKHVLNAVKAFANAEEEEAKYVEENGQLYSRREGEAFEGEEAASIRVDWKDPQLLEILKRALTSTDAAENQQDNQQIEHKRFLPLPQFRQAYDSDNHTVRRWIWKFTEWVAANVPRSCTCNKYVNKYSKTFNNRDDPKLKLT